MLSYTQRRNFYAKLTRNSDPANLSHGDTLMNEYERDILSSRPWWFLKRQKSQGLTNGTQFYGLPNNFGRLESISVLVGSTRYTPREARNQKHWDFLNQSSVSSDIPEWVYLLNREYGFYPTSSGNGTATVTYMVRHKDLTVADYTTGGVRVATNGSKNIEGTATVWTSQMAGRWLRITDGNNTTSGDGEWYEIDEVSSGTAVVLVRPYQGSTISNNSGSSYAIAQVSLLPEDYHSIPVYWAAADNLEGINPDMARNMRQIGDRKYQSMVAVAGSQSNSPVIQDSDDDVMGNPNLFVEL